MVFSDDKLAEELLTIGEVAQELRVDTTTVRRWITSGALEAVALPYNGKRRGYRVKKRTLDTLLNTTAMRAS
ncbi:MAG: helix-turn-helix domain-containing protein [Ktedonobacteraceae bacterium]|nr:helix-turn-helix domain-containing protein [Ktedonobacteraceae bacterium]